MNVMTINYDALSSAAIIKVCELADMLGCTPKRAAVLYIAYVAESYPERKEAV